MQAEKEVEMNPAFPSYGSMVKRKGKRETWESKGGTKYGRTRAADPYHIVKACSNFGMLTAQCLFPHL